MKIMLIQPPKASVTIGGEDVFLYEPLALEYVAAGVAQDHDVRILDMRLEKDLSNVLEDFQPQLVGITAYTVHVNVVRRLFDQIKQWNPGVLTVVGGHHATVAPIDFLWPSIDLIVMGEGVEPFREIVRRSEKGVGFGGIPGVTFAQDGCLVHADSQPIADLDAFPLPERWLTAPYRKHYFSEWMKPLATMRTSKGCPYRCSFCALWKLAGGRYLKRQPEKVVEELATLEEPFVFFADDELLVDGPRMKRLAELIKAAGIKKRYFLYGRSDTIARNPDLLAMWRNIGLERVFVGLEFCTDEDLQFIHKGSTVGDNEQAIKILHDLGIELYASFIVRPEFTRKDFAFFRQYCRGLGLSFPTFAVLTPLPGTDFFEEIKDRLLTNDYDFFDFIHTLLPTHLPLDEFYEEYYRLSTKAASPWKKLSTVPKYHLRDLLVLQAKGKRFYSRLRFAYRDYQ